jgi:hypothetical protein
MIVSRSASVPPKRGINEKANQLLVRINPAERAGGTRGSKTAARNAQIGLFRRIGADKLGEALRDALHRSRNERFEHGAHRFRFEDTVSIESASVHRHAEEAFDIVRSRTYQTPEQSISRPCGKCR